LSELLSKCPNLKILVTSREKLRLEEEYLFVLEGLSYPQTPSSEVILSDAVQLFTERAGQVQSRFDVEQNLNDVLRICQLVEGLPLGIELAASWVRLMSCQEIASEIERGLELLTSASKNIPERHRSLKAAFEQSWKLLTSKEQETLRKLSVFIGGFRREAASEVAGATIPVLASLVDKSLLRVLSNGRYDRHPLLYQFTREKLAEQTSEDHEARVKHAKYFFSLVEQAEPNLQSYDQLFWFGRLDEELDNIRAVLAWLEDEGEAETFSDLASRLGRFWFIRGYYNEGRSYLSKAVDLAPDSKAVAKALAFAGNITFIQGDIATAKTCYERSLTAAKGWDDKIIATLALHGLGRIAFMNEGNPSLGRTHYQESLALARAANDPYSIAFVLASLGYLTREQGDYALARTYFEESLQVDEAIGNQLGAAENMNSLANLCLEQGERSKALPLYEKSLEIYRAFHERRGIVQELANMGVAAHQLGEYHKAYKLHEEALQLARELGDKRATVDMLNYLASDLLCLEDYANANALFEQCLVVARVLGNKWQLGDILRNLADVCEARGEPDQARAYYQQCLELAREVNDQWGVAHTAYPLALWYLDHDDVVTAYRLLKEALDIALEMQLRELVIKSLEGFARLALEQSLFIKAAQLFGYTATLRETLDLHYTPLRQRRYEVDLERVKSQLGASFKTNWSLGKKMKMEEILELVLKSSDSSPQPTTTATFTKVTNG
jgi:predicted ATPase